MARQRAAAELAQQGKYRCRHCQAVQPLEDGIVVTWGGNVFFALCPTCVQERPIVIKQSTTSDGRKAFFVGFLNEEDRPSSLLPVSSMNQLSQFVPQGALAKYHKTDFDEE